MRTKTVILMVIDGLGLRKETQGNGFALAHTPVFDNLFKQYPYSIIQASGEFVGLPEGQMGNSEVGHLNIGAGFVVHTGISLINKAIKEKTFASNPKFIKAFDNSKKTNTPLQIIGLLSPGGVHSSETHLFELLKAAQAYGVKQVVVHIIGDGRDVAPKSILKSIEKLETLLAQFENYTIGSIAGRFYTMDRDQMFDRVQLGFDAILGKSNVSFSDVSEYINQQYEENITDEFFVPAINKNLDFSSFLKDNQSIIFFNFRPDRTRQLTHLILDSSLYTYKSEYKVKVNVFVSMMKYEGLATDIAFEEVEVKKPLGKVISEHNLTQLRLAETQKYAHVTFFMDGGFDIELPKSDRILVDSLKVASYANAPQMSAKEITDALLANAHKYNLVIMNFANPDMVGHTGDLQATIKAVEVLDQQIGRIKDWVESNDATLFITADHGNAELTEDENHQPSTKHTTFPVMLITTDKSLKLKDGKLANIAPTILDYLEIEKPLEMNEESLIIK
ncbi:2,3-bisphosphoglycerate-independent phosphoglycerate mutase [Mesomycoplasma hyorhinis]|uniref:2,3-bisphosphoglycerate-independent phosphoglycerate mutase n=1 Tax=Mesomycoplasma hyorhinis TaxID=2100 RepID=UPI001C04E61F|nr:2,3-bisphosphoglycerate-independent phosphoglycerate mutase [Mesomycoplasma hyorhinis]